MGHQLSFYIYVLALQELKSACLVHKLLFSFSANMLLFSLVLHHRYFSLPMLSHYCFVLCLVKSMKSGDDLEINAVFLPCYRMMVWRYMMRERLLHPLPLYPPLQLPLLVRYVYERFFDHLIYTCIKTAKTKNLS